MRALVTGGGGFLGGAIVRALKDRGHDVRSFSRSFYPHLAEVGVEQYNGSLADELAVRRAVEGCDVVFHVAAKVDIWGKYSGFHRANVLGTTHVIEACRRHGVPRLVYTSSPSVVFNGRDMEGVDESVDYGLHFDAYYPQTKAIAERLVRQARNSELATVALRPHIIWGPGDTQFVTRIIERARAGRLRLVGRTAKLIDTIYIDNAVDAHLLAAERLEPGCDISGNVYFISNGEPRNNWELINAMAALGDAPPETRRIPSGLAYAAGWAFEMAYGALRLSGEPRMTRFLAQELSTAHWFDISAARRDLGYEPRVSIDEGLQRLRAWLQAEGRSALTERRVAA